MRVRAYEPHIVEQSFKITFMCLMRTAKENKLLKLKEKTRDDFRLLSFVASHAYPK